MKTTGRGDALRRRKGVADRHGARRGDEKPEALKEEDERRQARKPRPPECITPAIANPPHQSPSPVVKTLAFKQSGAQYASTRIEAAASGSQVENSFDRRPARSDKAEVVIWLSDPALNPTPPSWNRLMELDPLILSRIQFAFVVSFHIIFPAFTSVSRPGSRRSKACALATGNAGLSARVRFLAESLRVCLRHGRGHRHRDGVPDRDELERPVGAHRARSRGRCLAMRLSPPSC